jgi:hypothetical protein
MVASCVYKDGILSCELEVVASMKLVGETDGYPRRLICQVSDDINEMDVPGAREGWTQ